MFTITHHGISYDVAPFVGTDTTTDDSDAAFETFGSGDHAVFDDLDQIARSSLHYSSLVFRLGIERVNKTQCRVTVLCPSDVEPYEMFGALGDAEQAAVTHTSGSFRIFEMAADAEDVAAIDTAFVVVRRTPTWSEGSIFGSCVDMSLIESALDPADAVRQAFGPDVGFTVVEGPLVHDASTLAALNSDRAVVLAPLIASTNREELIPIVHPIDASRTQIERKARSQCEHINGGSIHIDDPVPLGFGMACTQARVVARTQPNRRFYVVFRLTERFDASVVAESIKQQAYETASVPHTSSMFEQGVETAIRVLADRGILDRRTVQP